MGQIMYLFYDPSIKPITTTNGNGEFLLVRTEGLNSYGIPDIILLNYIDGYEELFLSIIHMIFKGEFNSNQTWNFEGQIFRLNKLNSGMLEICFETLDQIQIISLLNAISGEPLKYISKGISGKYGVPEIVIAANQFEAKALLAFVISEIEKGALIDEYSSIEYDGHVFILESFEDRYGAKQHLIRELATQKISYERRHLKRIK